MRYRVLEYILLDFQHKSQPQIDLREGYRNGQTAHRRLWNPLHNYMQGHPVDEVLFLNSIPCESHLLDQGPDEKQEKFLGYRSVTIPQYNTQVYLRKVGFRIGVLRVIDAHTSVGDASPSVGDASEEVFIDRSEDPRYTQMIQRALFGIVCYPQRAEYLLRDLSSEDTPRRPVTSCFDNTMRRHYTIGDNIEAEEKSFMTSVCAAFATDSCLSEISFPEGMGLRLDYSDIVLLDYAWRNPTNVILGDNETCVLEVTYTVDDINLPVELEDELETYGFDLSYAAIHLGREPIQDLSVQWLQVTTYCPGQTKKVYHSDSIEIGGSVMITCLADDHCSASYLVSETGERIELLLERCSDAECFVASFHECSQDNLQVYPGYCMHAHDGHKICHAVSFHNLSGRYHLEITIDNPHEDVLHGYHLCAVYSVLNEWPISNDRCAVFLDSPLDPGKQIYYTN